MKGTRSGQVRRSPWHGGIGFEDAAASLWKDFKERVIYYFVPRLAQVAEGLIVDMREPPFPVNGKEAVGDAVHDDRQSALGFLKLRRAFCHPLLKGLVGFL